MNRRSRSLAEQKPLTRGYDPVYLTETELDIPRAPGGLGLLEWLAQQMAAAMLSWAITYKQTEPSGQLWMMPSLSCGGTLGPLPECSTAGGCPDQRESVVDLRPGASGCLCGQAGGAGRHSQRRTSGCRK